MSALILAPLAVFVLYSFFAAISLAADAIEAAIDRCAAVVVPDVKFGRIHD